MKKNRSKMQHDRSVKTRKSHDKRKETKQKRTIRQSNSMLKFILTRNFDLFNAIIANYMNSDFDAGIWDPIFPEIHEFNPSIPPLRELADMIVRKCQDDKGELTTTGKVLYTWLMMPLESKRKFYNQISTKLFLEDGTAKAHDSEIWNFSNNIKSVITLTLQKLPNSQEPIIASQVPSDGGTFIEALT